MDFAESESANLFVHFYGDGKAWVRQASARSLSAISLTR
jgi:hypothetical protein